MNQRDKRRYILAGVPADMVAGALNGDYVSLKEFNHIEIIAMKAVGAAAENATITITQAQNVAGLNAKALNFTQVVRMEGADLTAVTAAAIVEQASGNTFVLDGDSQGVYVIEFDANNLDVQNGFDCIRAAIADVGTTGTQFGAILYCLSEAKYNSLDANPNAN